jgi:hypothetical protein
MGLAIRVELANLVTVQRLHDLDRRKHRRPAALGYQDQRLHGCLPLRTIIRPIAIAPLSFAT